MAISEPMEILELQDKESLSFRATGYELGQGTIQTRDGRGAKDVPILRVYVQPLPQMPGVRYLDVTAKRLVAQLEPILKSPVHLGREIVVTKYGIPPKAFFSVEVKP